MEMDLYNDLQTMSQQLDASLKMLRKNGIALAEAERDYKILLRRECLKLRDAGTAIGMISMIAYGIPEVAEARFKRDVADAVYKANIEAINTKKLQMRLTEGQLQREWSASLPD